MNPEAHILRVLYFGRLSEQLKCREESLVLPNAEIEVRQLRDLLIARGGQWTALNDSRIRVAVNQAIAAPEDIIDTGDEVAFFPPVTGG